MCRFETKTMNHSSYFSAHVLKFLDMLGSIFAGTHPRAVLMLRLLDITDRLGLLYWNRDVMGSNP